MEFVALPTTLIEYGTLIFALGHTACATAVTLHALITKRDVPTVIGWIGLAWLSPYFGSLLYVCFGINRVSRRARRMVRSGNIAVQVANSGRSSVLPDERLRKAIGQITGQRISTGTISKILVRRQIIRDSSGGFRREVLAHLG